MNDITTYNDDGNKYETVFSRCQGQPLSKHAEAEAAAKAFCVWRDIEAADPVQISPTLALRLPIAGAPDATTPLVSAFQIVMQSPWRPAQALPPHPAGVCTAALSHTPDRADALRVLGDLARLGPDWDGYGAEPISSRCIANASALLAALRPGIPSPELTPNPNGTLTLDWEVDGQTLSLELGATRFSGFSVGATPDEQFGTVCTFPSEVLDHILSDMPH